MSIIDNLQNSTRTQLTSKADVNINLGDGHSTIRVTGKDVKIDTGCGDQDIEVKASGDLDIDTGFCGEDKITAVVGGNATVVTREDNDTINMFVNGNFAVDAGMVDPKCGAEEDNDKITIVSNSTSGQNYVATGDGNDTVHLIANNVDVKKNEGTLEMGFIGNNYNINSDANGLNDQGVSNLIAGWGDNVTMNLSTDHAASNKIYTLDQMWSIEVKPDEEIKTEEEKKINDQNKYLKNRFTTDFWQGTDNKMLTSLTLGNGQEINFVNAMDNIIKSYQTEETRTDVTSEVVDTDIKETTTESISGKTNVDIAKQYGIPQSVVDSIDFSATLADGSPKYAIVGRYNGRSYQIYERKENNGRATCVYAGSANNLNWTSNMFGNSVTKIAEATKTTTTTKTQTDTIKTTTTTTTENALYRLFDGVKDWQVNTGDGKLTGHITARDGYININGGEACNNEQVRDIIVDSGYITRDVLSSTSTSVDKYTKESKVIDIQTKTEKITSAIDYLFRKIASPLIIDTNGDGKVSASAGMGVDLNNDGRADGAATGGDKMLAMTDLNGNGKIDGAEVFGDKTVSPFTKQPINAKNGFEALKIIAEQAKQYTGIDCMDGSSVDMKKLEQALAKVGVKLGFISENNNTTVEDFSGVSKIDVGNYTESARTGSEVEHLQHSTYTDENGVSYKVDDVWFEI